MTPDEADTIADKTAQLTVDLAEHQQRVMLLIEERAELIQTLRAEGWSYGKIADATGLSRSRVAQIAPGYIS